MEKIILLFGLPGSGKSTYANEQGIPVVCPDDIRKIIAGGCYGDYEFNIENESLTWLLAELMVKSIIKGKSSVIIDAVNINVRSRAQWLAYADKYNLRAECVVFNTSKDTCIQRRKYDNKNSSKADYESIINRMSAGIQMPNIDEGFDVIIYR